MNNLLQYDTMQYTLSNSDHYIRRLSLTLQLYTVLLMYVSVCQSDGWGEPRVCHRAGVHSTGLRWPPVWLAKVGLPWTARSLLLCRGSHQRLWETGLPHPTLTHTHTVADPGCPFGSTEPPFCRFARMHRRPCARARVQSKTFRQRNPHFENVISTTDTHIVMSTYQPVEDQVSTL